MNIVLITGHQYPTGTALTNRIRSYLEVLASLSNKVSVLVYKPSEDRKHPQNQRMGVLSGVEYRYTSYTIYQSQKRYMTFLAWVYGYINCLIKLIRINRRKHIDIIILAQARCSLIPFVYLLTRATDTKFLLENSEFPWFLIRPKASNWFYRPLYQKLYYRLFDGVIAMTSILQEYHQKYGKKDIRIIHLPMTVDMSRFTQNVPRENRITYIGNKSFHKDGVDILLRAFVSIADRIAGWNLVIVGDSGNDDAINDRAKSHGLAQRVLTLGNVHRDEVPPLLLRSKILALARPHGIQSEGGFPTKLGEYLASGNLVIVTDVGEITQYLQDGVSALVAQADDDKDFALKLEYAITQYENLEHIRQAGFNVCRQHFNAEVQGKRLNEFFVSLVSRVRTG
ncbi:MAG: glycosyltransferase family 4 protein [Candidatus Cloacimonetes bacterium]|nr:glycosyltransferase family 4 protein [Candidatus Cloacimonadota bacterium]